MSGSARSERAPEHGSPEHGSCELGRDAISGLQSVDLAPRARDVSRPVPADERDAERAIDALLSRLDGRRSTALSGGPRGGR